MVFAKALRLMSTWSRRKYATASNNSLTGSNAVESERAERLNYQTPRIIIIIIIIRCTSLALIFTSYHNHSPHSIRAYDRTRMRNEISIRESTSKVIYRLPDQNTTC